jgi:hypothetical protein
MSEKQKPNDLFDAPNMMVGREAYHLEFLLSGSLIVDLTRKRL